MKVTYSVDGLRELDDRLGQFTKATARNVLKRTLVHAARPMVEEAARLAPKDTGALSQSIAVSARTVGSSVGKAEFASVMKSGGTRAEARQALLAAQRDKGMGGSFAEVYLGPLQSTRRATIKAYVMEFGSYKDRPQPYMRPAFESQTPAVLRNIAAELSAEIDRTAMRVARRAARKAGRS